MKNNKKNNSKQPMIYWLVDITLKSGNTLQFFVSAINQVEAYKKADEYALLAEHKMLEKIYGDFKLMP